MKKIVFITLALICGGIVFWMQTRVRENLETESEKLKDEKRTVLAVGVEQGSGNERLLPEDVGEKFVKSCLDDLIDLDLSNESAEGAENFEEAFDNILRQIQWFSPSDIASFVELLRIDSRFSEKPNLVEEVFSEMIVRAAPKSSLLYLKDYRDFEDWSLKFREAFSECLGVDLRWALALYEEGRAKGDLDFQTSPIRSSVLLALGKHDPDRMLELAMEDEFKSDRDAVMHLGGFSANMKNSEEHRAFLSALNSAVTAHPEEALLVEVRQDYLNEIMGSSVYTWWPFEEASSILEGELSREERFRYLDREAHMHVRVSPEKWAAYFQKIDVTEWEEWSAGLESPVIHPLANFMDDWTRMSPSMADGFMEELPEGELREHVVANLVDRLRHHDSEKAREYFEELPEGTQKEKLRRKLEH